MEIAEQTNQDCLAVETLQQLLSTNKANLIVIDVRSPEEYAESHIPAAINIPIDSLANSLNEIAKDRQIVTVCAKGGGRSASASELLKKLGYKNVHYLCGGTLGWYSTL